jgi:hypothetical protein
MHWLAKGKPGGHTQWDFLDDKDLQAHYEKKLSELGKCDTIIAIISR